MSLKEDSLLTSVVFDGFSGKILMDFEFESRSVASDVETHPPAQIGRRTGFLVFSCLVEMKRGPSSPDCGEVVCPEEGAVRLRVVVPAVAGTGRGGSLPGIW